MTINRLVKWRLRKPTQDKLYYSLSGNLKIAKSSGEKDDFIILITAVAPEEHPEFFIVEGCGGADYILYKTEGVVE